MNRFAPSFSLLALLALTWVACGGGVDYGTIVTKKGQFAGAEALLSAEPPPPHGPDGGAVSVGPCNGEGPIDGGPCSVSFAEDLMPLLVASCGSATCHGVPAGAKPRIDRASAANTYASFLAQRTIEGKPYVDVCSLDSAKSAIACNLGATPCGTGMPYGATGSLATSPLATGLDTWLACGAPNN